MKTRSKDEPELTVGFTSDPESTFQQWMDDHPCEMKISEEIAQAEFDRILKAARVLAEFVCGLPQISGPLDEDVLSAVRILEATKGAP